MNSGENMNLQGKFIIVLQSCIVFYLLMEILLVLRLCFMKWDLLRTNYDCRLFLLVLQQCRRWLLY